MNLFDRFFGECQTPWFGDDEVVQPAAAAPRAQEAAPATDSGGLAEEPWVMPPLNDAEHVTSTMINSMNALIALGEYRAAAGKLPAGSLIPSMMPGPTMTMGAGNIW